MLERIKNNPGEVTISVPNIVTCRHIESNIKHKDRKNFWVAEIGVGIGATSLEIAKILNNEGQLHLFDFEPGISELKRDLNNLGYHNIVAYGNTKRYLDSYNWHFVKLIEKYGVPIYDYVYLDGSHTFAHDALAFFLLDKLIKPGGCLDFDDYGWSYTSSPTMNPQKNPRILEYMTDEQLESKQIQLIVDLLVRPDPRYEEILENKVFFKKH